MKLKFPFLFATNIFLLIPFLFTTSAQDSLYLVGTITGESNEKRITNITGIGDINGDGYDDFMISERNGFKAKDQGIIKFYFGSSTLDLIPDITFHYPGDEDLNDFSKAYGIGDINNDGYDDFAISGAFGDWGFPKGKVFIYHGGEKIDTLPIAEFNEPWIQDNFGFVTELGDINKDGYDDFTISSPYNWTNATGHVYLFWGGDTISFNRCDTIKGFIGEDHFGISAANIGDLNKDGFDDIGIGAFFSEFSEEGIVYIFFTRIGMNAVPDTFLLPTIATYDFGRIVKNGGDINKDGIIDLTISSNDYIFFYNGINNLVTIDGSLLGFGGYIYIESNLDINNDDYTDFTIGNTNYKNSDSIMVGGAFIYLGNEKIDTVYKYKLEGENKWDEFSKIISYADINGDGYDEIFILAPNYPNYEFPLGKIYIYSFKNLTDVEDFKKINPDNFQLFQNYPNPFNPFTKIQYSLNKLQNISIKLYDILGNKIVTLIDEEKPAGKYEIEFNASKYNLSSGTYFCELNVKGGGSSRIKLIYLK